MLKTQAELSAKTPISEVHNKFDKNGSLRRIQSDSQSDIESKLEKSLASSIVQHTLKKVLAKEIIALKKPTPLKYVKQSAIEADV